MLPKYPRKRSAWAECDICGEDHPVSEMVLHFRTKKLVDRRCADEKAQSDILRDQVLPVEEENVSLQPVRDQGQMENLYEDQDVTGGAGLGGSGTGHP